MYVFMRHQIAIGSRDQTSLVRTDRVIKYDYLSDLRSIGAYIFKSGGVDRWLMCGIG